MATGVDALRESIATALQRVVATGALPGVQGIVWRPGSGTVIVSAGLRDISTGAPVDNETLFRLASMTKPVTSVLALMLLEEGLLEIETPAHVWVPELSEMRVLQNPTGSLDDTRPANASVTIGDLLSHRAGFGYPFTTSGPISAAYTRFAGAGAKAGFRTNTEWLAGLSELPLASQPGERFLYGFSTDVLGVVLERITGASLGDLMRERIFEPLSMTDTGFEIAGSRAERAATLYRHDAERDNWAPSADVAYSALRLGGDGLVSTGSDYLKFARFLFARGRIGDRRLLRPESVALLTGNRFRKADHEQLLMGMPFWAGQGFGMGVSVIVDEEANRWMGPGAAGAFGWPGVLGTWWRVDPQKQLVLVYMSQHESVLAPVGSPVRPRGRALAAQAALPAFVRAAYQATE